MLRVAAIGALAASEPCLEAGSSDEPTPRSLPLPPMEFAAEQGLPDGYEVASGSLGGLVRGEQLRV